MALGGAQSCGTGLKVSVASWPLSQSGQGIFACLVAEIVKDDLGSDIILPLTPCIPVCKLILLGGLQ